MSAWFQARLLFQIPSGDVLLRIQISVMRFADVVVLLQWLGCVYSSTEGHGSVDLVLQYLRATSASVL